MDEIVVGAGITGLTTGLLLARAGRRVAVVEAREVGAVATGNTTAKVSLLQGTKYSQLLRYQSKDVAGAYVDANREGLGWLLRFCEDHGVPVQRRPAFTYAATESELPTVRKEYDAAKSLGLDVVWRDWLDVPFPSHGAAVLEDQAQFDPMDFLRALAAQLREHGGTLHQGLRVTGVSLTGAPEVDLEDGTTLRAEHVVLATGVPILDRGLYFSKVEPQRSYALAFDFPNAPEGMYLSAGSDSRSIRDAPADGGTRLLVGGSGHSVGRTTLGAATRRHPARLDRVLLPGRRGDPPVVGPGLLPARRRALRRPAAPGPGAHLRRHRLRQVGDDQRGRRCPGDLRPDPGRGAVLGQADEPAIDRSHLPWLTWRRSTRRSGLAAAGSVIDGVRRDRPCEVIGVCTHLGGLLHWNDVEDSWDCPLHGSRFSADGSVLEGPATRPLFRRSKAR